MQSPYLIMICDLWDPTDETPADDKALAGTICSSLHRLKDIDNKGMFNLRFALLPADNL